MCVCMCVYVYSVCIVCVCVCTYVRVCGRRPVYNALSNNHFLSLLHTGALAGLSMLLYKSPFTALYIAIKAIEVIMMSLLCNNNCK